MLIAGFHGASESMISLVGIYSHLTQFSYRHRKGSAWTIAGLMSVIGISVIAGIGVFGTHEKNASASQGYYVIGGKGSTTTGALAPAVTTTTLTLATPPSSSNGADTTTTLPQSIKSKTQSAASAPSTELPTTTTVPVAQPVGITAGMHLAFTSSFQGSSLNGSKWQTCYPWADSGSGCTNFDNSELEWYLPSQDQVSNGALHLTASKVTTIGTTSAGSPASYQWKSGMVTTNNSFDFTYGYVQVTAHIPTGSGLWPALWLLPQNESWPPEIDIMENLGGNTSRIYCTVHPSLGGESQEIYNSPTNLSSGWHTYAVNWEPHSITWYIDGHQVFTYSANIPQQPMYFLANLAVSGTGQVPNASTPNTASFDISNVSIYQH
jgi:beta-glucanase (GH16 family)